MKHAWLPLLVLILLAGPAPAEDLQAEGWKFGGVAPGEAWKTVRQRLGPPVSESHSKGLDTYGYADGTGMEVRKGRIYNLYGFPKVTSGEKVLVQVGDSRDAALKRLGEPLWESPEQPGTRGVQGPEGQVAWRVYVKGVGPYTLACSLVKRKITHMALHPVEER